jgi:hypothetical protein
VAKEQKCPDCGQWHEVLDVVDYPVYDLNGNESWRTKLSYRKGSTLVARCPTCDSPIVQRGNVWQRFVDAVTHKVLATKQLQVGDI